eukprot:s1358_g20.t1
MAALVGSACHSVFFSQFVLLAAFVQGCVGFGCCRIPVLFRFIDDRRNIYSDQFKSVIQAMGDEAGRPSNKPLPVWARPTSGPKPTEFTEPGPRIAVVVRSIWESMCQVPEGLKQKAARHSLEGGSAEEEVGWVGDRLVQPLICPGMPGHVLCKLAACGPDRGFARARHGICQEKACHCEEHEGHEGREGHEHHEGDEGRFGTAKLQLHRSCGSFRVDGLGLGIVCLVLCALSLLLLLPSQVQDLATPVPVALTLDRPACTRLGSLPYYCSFGQVSAHATEHASASDRRLLLRVLLLPLLPFALMQVPTSTTPLSTDALAVTSCRLYPCRFFVRAHMLLHLIALAWPGFSQQQRMHAIAATVGSLAGAAHLLNDNAGVLR